MPAFSSKRIAIDKANATLVLAISIATFIVMFSLVASKSLLDQRSYQSSVISKKKTALNSLQGNIVAADNLIASYTEFKSAQRNIIGGNASGDAPKDGDNPQIVLDALPSKYDFPALATSLEKLVKENGFPKISTIKGVDDEVQQSGLQSQPNPIAVEIPFSVSIAVPKTKGRDLMQLFERSIRPMTIQKLVVTTDADELTVTIDGKTHFQPEKNLQVRTEAVK